MEIVRICLDDAFFNWTWAGACWGRWAEPGLMLKGWVAGSWVVGAEGGLLECWSSGFGRGTYLQKKRRKGGRRGFARGRSDA